MIKRIFDFLVSLCMLLLFSCFFIIAWCLAMITTNSFGFFLQKRVGQFGETFTIYKLKTIHPKTKYISRIGYFLRISRLDEFPQLWNIIKGEMSLVGPRPDIVGYYDTLKGEERNVLVLKPGLMSEAAIKYANEDLILKEKADPLEYNDLVI